MKSVLVLIIIAVLSLVIGMVLRSMGICAPRNVTPSAFLRFTDTMLLFAIALGLYFLARRKSK